MCVEEACWKIGCARPDGQCSVAECPIVIIVVVVVVVGVVVGSDNSMNYSFSKAHKD
jgi:hypothetical protein